jgi:protein gp37
VKLGIYEVHPAAAIFPTLPDDELKQLADDIQRNGLQEPVVLTADRKVLVDGRNRYLACDMLNIEPVYDTLPEYYGETEILAYIVSANIRRRHLTAGQRDMAAADLEPFYAAAAKERQLAGLKKGDQAPVKPEPAQRGQARDQAAAAVGARPQGVSQAKALKEQAPDLAEKVKTGQMALDAADKERKKRNATKPKPDKSKPTKTYLTLLTHENEEVKYPQPQGNPAFNETQGDGISWAAWSWNPVTGCLHGCPYCYARAIAADKRFKDAYPAGFTPLFHTERLDAPKYTTIPKKHQDDPAYRRVFVCSMADLYGRWVPRDWIKSVHAAMVESPQWQYITLTKFPDRYAGLQMPAGAWVGTSIDEQRRVRIAQRAFDRLPPGQRDGGDIVKWLSLEPLREDLKFDDLSMFDWVVIGAQTATYQPDGKVESFAPPFTWVSRITEQALTAGCRVHHKPNLLGKTDGSSPGMQMLDEYPGVSPL